MFTRRRRKLRVTLAKDTAPGHGRPRPVRRAAQPPAGRWITLIALLYAFIPSVSHAYWIFNPLEYGVLILAGILVIGIVPPLLMDRLRKPRWKAACGLRSDGLNVSGSQ